MKRYYFLIVLLISLFPLKAFAGEFYIGPKAGAFLFPDDTQTINILDYGNIAKLDAEVVLDNSFTFGMKTGGTFKPLPEWINLEFEIGYLNPDGILNAIGSSTVFNIPITTIKAADIKTDVLSFGLNGILQYPKGTLRPYLGAGLGALYADVELDFNPVDGGKETDDDTGLGPQVLGGLKIKTPLGYIFTETKFIYTRLNLFGYDVDVGGLEIMGGFLFKFGGKN